MPDDVGLPKAELVARTLAREIREGRVAHGAQLDSEGGLMRRFEVSRNTVRRGLEILARQGLITTRTGIGSFVRSTPAKIFALSEIPGRRACRIAGSRWSRWR